MNSDSLNNIAQQLAAPSQGIPRLNAGLGVDLVFIIIALAGIIFGFFYLLRKYLMPLLESVNERRRTRLIVWRVEVITWLVFALLTLTQLFTENWWVTLALVTVVAWIGSDFWRNFFPGLWFRISNQVKEGDLVRYDNYTGLVVQLGKTCVAIKTENEELLFIPYRKITDELFVKRQAKGKLLSAKLIIPVDGANEALVDRVNRWVKICPWAVPQPHNSATLNADGYLHISVYAVDAESLGKAEHFLRSKIRNNS